MTTNLVTIVCSECGVGHYLPTYVRHVASDSEWFCSECAHEINASDVTLEPGEILTDVGGFLAYTTEG